MRDLPEECVYRGEDDDDSPGCNRKPRGECECIPVRRIGAAALCRACGVGSYDQGDESEQRAEHEDRVEMVTRPALPECGSCGDRGCSQEGQYPGCPFRASVGIFRPVSVRDRFAAVE